MTQHALYRFYGADGSLLYVGITLNPTARWAKHADTKPWWHEVTRITLETLPAREAVLAAERRAIQDERPLHNVVHNRATTPDNTAAPSATDLASKYLFAPGDVIAVGVDPDKAAPCGLVNEVDQRGFGLDLYSWLTGYFGYDTRYIRWGQVKSFTRAEPMPKETAERLGHRPGLLIWDMDPLAEFQNDWKASRP